MATPHLAISLLDLRAFRRIYCCGVSWSWCREGHLKKQGWYIFFSYCCSSHHVASLLLQWQACRNARLTSWFTLYDGLGKAWAQVGLEEHVQGSDGEESLKTCASGRGRLVEMRGRISQLLYIWACCLQVNVVWITRLSIQQSYQHVALAITVVMWILCKTVFSVEVLATKWKCFLCPRTQKVCYGGQ